MTLGLLGAALLACDAILGLTEPTLDNSLGNDAAQSEDGGDANNGADGPANDAGSDVIPSTGPVQFLNEPVTRIALDDTTVYYTDEDFSVVAQVDKDGQNQIILATGSATAGITPYAIALDASNVYWASAQGIHACPKSTCANAPIDIIDDQSSQNLNPGDIGVDSTFVYFVNYANDMAGTSSIMKVSKTTAAATATTVVPKGQICVNVDRMILYGAMMYFTCDNGVIGRVPTSGSPVETLSVAADAGPPLHADRFVSTGADASIYYSTYTTSASFYQMANADDSPATALVGAQPYPAGIAIDPTYLYWVDQGVAMGDGNGTLNRCTLGSCSASISPLVNHIDVPDDIAVDDAGIFWAALSAGDDTPGCGLWRMTKPP